MINAIKRFIREHILLIFSFNVFIFGMIIPFTIIWVKIVNHYELSIIINIVVTFLIGLLIGHIAWRVTEYIEYVDNKYNNKGF